MSEKIGKGGLLRSSAVVSVMTLLSRVLGMVRDMVVASYFGSGAAADAFFIAFKIPNFLRRLFAEGPSPRPSCRCCRITAPSARWRTSNSWWIVRLACSGSFWQG